MIHWTYQLIWSCMNMQVIFLLKKNYYFFCVHWAFFNIYCVHPKYLGLPYLKKNIYSEPEHGGLQ